MPFSVRPLKTVVARVWKLLCNGESAGSYTDHCNRPFVAGDVLRDDHDNRCTVLSDPVPDKLTLNVSAPDVATVEATLSQDAAERPISSADTSSPGPPPLT